jgi:hypothetical protein
VLMILMLHNTSVWVTCTDSSSETLPMIVATQRKKHLRFQLLFIAK